MMKAAERRRRRVLAVDKVGVVRSLRGILVKREVILWWKAMVWCLCFFFCNIGNENGDL